MNDIIYWICNGIMAAALSILLAGIVIPQILLIAFRRRLFDQPDARKIHTSAVPRLGGLAFMPVVFFVISLLLGIGVMYRPQLLWPLLHEHTAEFCFGFCALLMIYMVGMADDLVGVKYRAKFVAQILCSIMVIAGGVWLDNMHGLLGFHEIPEWAGWPLTIFSMVFIINAINLIDGIDGLASGLMSVTLMIYAVLFFEMGHYIYSAISMATLGVLIPFFYYNVFGNPNKQKKIFMGDTGALTIGMLVSILGLSMIQCEYDASGANMFVVAFSPLIVPCFDVVRVYLKRIHEGHNPFMPDKSHIHHLLLALGWSQRRSLCVIILTSLLFTCMNVLLSFYININWLLVIDFVLWSLAITILAKVIRRKNGSV